MTKLNMKFVILSLSLTMITFIAAVDNDYYKTVVILAQQNKDKEGAIETYRKMTGPAADPKVRTAVAQLKKLGVDPVPKRWSELDNADLIAAEAVKVYKDHSVSLAGALADPTSAVKDQNVKNKLQQISDATK